MRAQFIMTRFTSLLWGCLIALLINGFVMAQGSDPERPKIGVALSGGSARGLAHIGFLRLLEELRIPVDYIGGTSMGSIIGGLYASGMSPDEIAVSVAGMDWGDLFDDRPPRHHRSFRRKQDDKCGFIAQELGIKGFMPIAPRGLVSGQKLALALRFTNLHTPDDLNFDDLNIPFRAVATDLETGEMVVLSKGSLVHALRASMSIPALFGPVHHQGRILVDGGMVRNLPADVVKDMGADIVIAVDVGVPLENLNSENINSLGEVLGQSTNIFINHTSQEALKKADLVVKMAVNGVNSLDFNRADEIIATGRKLANEYIDELSQYSVSQAEYDAWVKKHRYRSDGPRIIDDIRIENGSRVSDGEIKRRLKLKPGQAFDLDQLALDLGRIFEIGIFESVDYRLHIEDGKNILLIRVREKYYAPNILSIGFVAQDDLEGKSDFGFLFRVTKLEMNNYGGELRADLRLGISRGLKLEWYQPCEASRTFFMAPMIEVGQQLREIYIDQHPIADFEINHIGAGIDVGLNLKRFAEFRIGIIREEICTDIEAGTAPVDEVTKSRAAFTAQVEHDYLDDPDFPTSGGSAKFRYLDANKKLGGDDDYQKLRGDFAQFATISSNTMFLTLSGGSSMDTDLPFEDQFVLGGMHSFSGWKEDQKSGEFFGTARLGYYRPVLEGAVFFSPTLYVGGWFEVGNIWESVDDVTFSDLRVGGSLMIGAKTSMGPIQISYGRSDDGYGSFYLSVGHQFGSY